MIDPIFEFFEKLITQFTWRRLIFILLIVFMAVGSLIAYETYTGHFRLNRIERSVKLLKDLAALSPDIQKSGNNEITKIFEGLTDSLNTYVNHRLTPFSFPSWLLKAIA